MKGRSNSRPASRSLIVCGPLILFAALASTSFAAIRPSFFADSEAWRATDIALVATTSNDRAFEVIETWKGPLVVGDTIVVPQLAPPHDALPIPHWPNTSYEVSKSPIAQQLPRQPIGSHMILFLRRNSTCLGPTPWEPANRMGSMKASVVWIDAGRLYVFTQIENPGPSILEPLSVFTDESLKNRVLEVIQLQVRMIPVLATAAGEQRARLLEPFVQSEVFEAKQFAIEELGNSGPAAFPVFCGMLDDPAYSAQADELIPAMVKAGGDGLGEELRLLLQREVAFWKSTGPSLPSGRWNMDSKPPELLQTQ